MRPVVLLIVVISTNVFAFQTVPALMPKPAIMQLTESKQFIDKNFTVRIEGPRSVRLVQYTNRFIRRLAGRTGIFFKEGFAQTDDTQSDHQLLIKYKEVGSLDLNMAEQYELAVEPSGITLLATSDIGAMRGLETLLQTLQPNRGGYYFTGILINDEPRFVWRGLLVDAGRHFIPVAVLKRNLDGLAAVKMNVFHWHLTEDQGFRIESKVFPELHQQGSDGNFYTQEQVREIVSYAHARGIRVVPEFDIPGHVTSWVVSHPELASGPGPYSIERTFGVKDAVLDPSNEATYQFLATFFKEMAELFPDEYMHIGGDENNGRQWNNNGQIQKFKQDKGFADNHALQTYFNQRISEILSGLDKKMVGWDEILNEALPGDIVIQSWRGKESLFEAASKGYNVILSNGYYIDLMQHAETHYLNDPLPADHGLSPQAQQFVLGGEATMWTELVTAETIDSRIWPRTAAIAERLWSPGEVKNVDTMYKRLDIINVQLEELGLTHIKNQGMMIRRLVGPKNEAVLKTLVDVIEPVSMYRRHSMQPFSTFAPFTRLADIAVTDTRKVRDFKELVNRYLKSQNPEIAAMIKEQLIVWKDNDEILNSVLLNNPVLSGAITLSLDLSTIAIIGLQAMSKDMLHDEVWKQAAAKQLDAARKPRMECELSVIDSIAELVLQAS
jgi:hexosaminidase